MHKVQDKKGVYLDAASTTSIHPEILKDLEVLNRDYYANADSLHEMGQRVSVLIDASRKSLAKRFGVLPHEVIFTSGASESNSTAIKGIALAMRSKGNHIITSCVEHSSVMGAVEQLETVFGFDVTYLPVDENGCVTSEVLKNALRRDTVLVSIMAVNNEIGSINNIAELTQIVKKHSSAFMHVDGVQALSKHDFSLQQIDAVSFSAHKIHGIKGSGLLIKKSHVPMVPLINGGQQEHGLRGGTSDTVADILWAKTVRLADETHVRKLKYIEKLHSLLWNAFDGQQGIVINSPRDGSPYIFNMSIENVGSEIMMNALNKKGYYVSARSTCHSESNSPSEILLAIGRTPAQGLSSIRISLSSEITEADILDVIEIIKETKKYVQHEL